MCQKWYYPEMAETKCTGCVLIVGNLYKLAWLACRSFIGIKSGTGIYVGSKCHRWHSWDTGLYMPYVPIILLASK